MSTAGRSPADGGWLAPALVALAVLTGWRLLALALAPLDLFVDEAQYWLWGQYPAFGYYSKPPLVGWLIGAVTAVLGDSTFAIRAPGPVLHGVTALILGAVANRLWGPRAALFTALSFATLPMVALASVLISTDTVMFPFLAAALWFWLEARDRPGPWAAVAAGACLGLALMAKYAAVYYLLGAVPGAALVPALRVRPGLALLAALAAAVTVAPNLIWNAGHGFSTFQHTLDNADWVRDPGARVSLSLAGPAEFLAAQFAVFGPVLFGALLALSVSAARGRTFGPSRWLLVFVLPPLIVVTVQAGLSKAYANWAASAYLAGTVAVVPWLLARARIWLALSLLVNGAAALALPVLVMLADRPAVAPMFERYAGRAALSQAIIAAAGREGLATVAAKNRDILADLFYTGRDSGLDFRAVVERGRPMHHYALAFPLDPAQGGEVLYVATGPVDECAGAQALGPLAGVGIWAGRGITLWRMPAGCLAP